MKIKTYTIPLNPTAWKRAGLSQSAHFYDKQKKEKIAMGLYLVNCHGSTPRFSGPLKVDIEFFLAHPKTLKERNMKSSYCYKTPDLDNLGKFALDSITDTDTIWEDDKQVADLHMVKVYDIMPRTIITIKELE